MNLRTLLATATLLAASFATAPLFAQDNAAKLPVFQNLDEATSRIPQLANKPIKKLIDANKGFFQNETIILKDVETGNEVWSLTREQCKDLANIERRCAWSCNGQYISFIGNTAFLDLPKNTVHQRPWAGQTYVANADSSDHRKLWGKFDGKLISPQDKFNNWDAKKPNVLYYPGTDNKQGILWRITLGDGVTDNKAEIIYHFPNNQLKIIEEVSDENFALVEEMGAHPNCYVLNLNLPPTDPHFCLTYPLKGEIHPGSFRFMRSQRVARGHYEKGGPSNSVVLGFADGKSLKLLDHDPAGDLYPSTKNRSMDHLWYGAPDDRVGFFGKYNDKHGLYLQLPGKLPIRMAEVPDGHVTWCGHDPNWFFGAVGIGWGLVDKQYARRLVACNIDGKTVKIICTPFDRMRPDEGGYDAIPRPNQSPDATKSWFHSSMLMPSNKYTGSYIAVFRKPYAPSKLSLKPQGKAVTLQWTPNPLSYEVKGYHVYRSADAGKTYGEITKEPVAGDTFTDTTAAANQTYTYAVTAEEWSRLESDTTSNTLTVKTTNAAPTTITTRAGITKWDTTAPAPVANFQAVKSDGLIKLQWTPSAAEDHRYYNIYASSTAKPAVQQQRLLVSPPHGDEHYYDWSAPAGQTEYYAITVVDRQGNESTPVFTEIK